MPNLAVSPEETQSKSRTLAFCITNQHEKLINLPSPAGRSIENTRSDDEKAPTKPVPINGDTDPQEWVGSLVSTVSEVSAWLRTGPPLRNHNAYAGLGSHEKEPGSNKNGGRMWDIRNCTPYICTSATCSGACCLHVCLSFRTLKLLEEAQTAQLFEDSGSLACFARHRCLPLSATPETRSEYPSNRGLQREHGGRSGL